LLRVTETGACDPIFSKKVKSLVQGYIEDVQILPNDKIFIAGDINVTDGNISYLNMAELTYDGELDGSFSSNLKAHCVLVTDGDLSSRERLPYSFVTAYLEVRKKR